MHDRQNYNVERRSIPTVKRWFEMLWCIHKKPFIFLLFLSIFLLIPFAEAHEYHLTHPTHFPSKSSSYLTFDSTLLPLTFTTLYRDSNTRWHFNDTWVTSTTDLTITVFHSSGWFNYTVSGAGTQEINNGTEPTSVLIDGIDKTKGDGWTYSGGTVTVTSASSNASLLWGSGGEPPDTEPPTWTSIRLNTTEAGLNCEFNCTWSDNTQLSGYIFGTDNSGSWVNETWTTLSGVLDIASVVKTLTSEVDKTIYYRFWCNDTSDNWGSTGTLPLTTTGSGVIDSEGMYLLRLKTTCNGLPCSANCTVENHGSKMSDQITGFATFTLSLGSYHVIVTYGGATQEKTINLDTHVVVPFDFFLEGRGPAEIVTLLVGIPLLAFIFIAGLIWIKKS